MDVPDAPMEVPDEILKETSDSSQGGSENIPEEDSEGDLENITEDDPEEGLSFLE